MKLITGVFQDPAEEYHSKKGYISSTPLRKIEHSPQHFFDAWTSDGVESNKAMDTGSLIHSVVLEQDIAKYCRRPLNDKGELVRSNSKEYAAFLAENEGKTPIHPDEYDQINAILESACSHPKGMEKMNGSRVEHSVYTKCPRTGLYLKARLDIWGKGEITDVKSTGKYLDDSYIKNIYYSGFDVQLAHYAYCVEVETGEVIENFFVWAFEQFGAFASRVYEIPKSDMIEAKEKHESYLNQIASCIQDNKYPSYNTEIVRAARPQYMQSQELSF